MKLQSSTLRKIIRESLLRVLTEEEKKKKEQDDSLDRQIDSYLISYEKEAKSVKSEAFDFRIIARNFFNNTVISEADEEKEKEEEAPEEKPKLTSEDIDLGSFTTSVVRLIDNYDSLLEVRDVITKRALNFLSKNYDESVASEFKNILEDQYDIVPGKTKMEKEQEDAFAPSAERAQGPGSAGGGGA